MPIPVVEEKLCSGCGECAEICEAKAIEIVGEKASVEYYKCYNYNGTNCSACVEVCPRGAIILID
ncbi:MAG: 4Fe-4S binding protein [Candidatus Methanospirareceae archaeon]